MKKWLLTVQEVIAADDAATYDNIVAALIANGKLRGATDPFTLTPIDETEENSATP